MSDSFVPLRDDGHDLSHRCALWEQLSGPLRKTEEWLLEEPQAVEHLLHALSAIFVAGDVVRITFRWCDLGEAVQHPSGHLLEIECHNLLAVNREPRSPLRLADGLPEPPEESPTLLERAVVEVTSEDAVALV